METSQTGYEGQPDFSEMLSKAGAKVTARELKSYLRGMLGAPRLVPQPEVFKNVVFAGAQPRLDSAEELERLLMAFMYFWDDVASNRLEQGMFRHPADEYPPTTAGLRKRIIDTYREVAAFLRGLTDGEIVLEALPPQGREAHAAVVDVEQHLSNYVTALGESDLPQEEIPEVVKVLDQFDETLDLLMVSLGIAMETARREALLSEKPPISGDSNAPAD
ncbi:MAG: hypothetical protein K6U74_16885 [Firmicutes bacterium]|nr:hypothetical protein [Bacillota bacterium]